MNRLPRIYIIPEEYRKVNKERDNSICYVDSLLVSYTNNEGIKITDNSREMTELEKEKYLYTCENITFTNPYID